MKRLLPSKSFSIYHTIITPDEVIEFFSIYLIRPAALWFTQLLTEMSTRNILRDEARPSRKADNLTAIHEPIG
jgi:hypothetical protein